MTPARYLPTPHAPGGSVMAAQCCAFGRFTGTTTASGWRPSAENCSQANQSRYSKRSLPRSGGIAGSLNRQEAASSAANATNRAGVPARPGGDEQFSMARLPLLTAPPRRPYYLTRNLDQGWASPSPASGPSPWLLRSSRAPGTGRPFQMDPRRDSASVRLLDLPSLP